MRYPDYLYETPDWWADDTIWLSRTGVERLIREMRRIDREWGEGKSVLDCDEWRHIGGGRYESVASALPGWHVWEITRPVRIRSKFAYDRGSRSWAPVGEMRVVREDLEAAVHSSQRARVALLAMLQATEDDEELAIGQ